MEPKTLEMDNRGNVAYVMALVSTAIVLYVAAIVIGKLSSIGASIGLTGDALAQFNNITTLTYNALTIASIGLLVIAAVSILSYFGIGWGGQGGGGKRRK
jgi:hypothetical protein